MVASNPVGREVVLDRLNSAFVELSYVYTMWQGGGAAFGRLDEWSDIDVHVVTDEDRIPEMFEIAEAALRSLSPIELQFEAPQPTWHGHHQRVYQLRDASPFLQVDLVVMKRDAEEKFVQPEIHGESIVHFDRIGFMKSEPLDRAELERKLALRVEELRDNFRLFRILALKELERGNALEALAFYQHYTLRPLIELLRIRLCPERHGFHTRYLRHDLPAALVDELEPLFFVTDLEDLRRKRDEAERRFERELERQGRA